MKRDHNILDKLKGKDTGFTVPDTYFDELDVDNFRPAKISKLELSKRIETGFTVPKDYFESVQPYKPIHSESTSTRVVRMFRRKVLHISIAASLLIFAGVKIFSSDSVVTEMGELTSEDFFAWVETEASQIDTYEIAEVFEELELDETYLSDEQLDGYVDEINIEEILIEN